MAAITELEELINKANPNILGRNQSWFKTWSQSGKQQDYTPAIKLIKEFEGCHLTAYADPLHGWDVATIGWGTTRYPDGRKVSQGDILTAGEADRLLQQEIDTIAKRLSTPSRTGARCELRNNQPLSASPTTWAVVFTAAAASRQSAPAKEAIDFIPASKGVDLFIVDYDLGDVKGNGLDLCRKIKAYAHKPVVMLTGETSTDTTVACLYAGADQYVLKPYDLKELLARIHSALHNQPKPSKDTSSHKLSVNDVELDGMARTLSCGPTSVKLTERELAVAEVLFANHNTEIKRDYIYSAVYGHQMKAFSRAADILIARFRKKLREISDDLLILPTRSAGYILVSKSNAQVEK
ncbi:MAG: hypothetical protein ABS30_09365 [OM182 bacterium BACL3 MAG-120924-bin41]|uniref:Lysozyme n=1 Tax=OM182 bacterium BACL3 MAG-120924-bin41 TaxID=1655632 RepID=A0A0R2WYX4_9GAMM|nr:MAG: hypothetical protein ABS30_09365 [OM182 bacterium BACL3 MAG-120924-bin41]